jgi:dipeptidyl aminopeptidase/acylaminoacyl peptidase
MGSVGTSFPSPVGNISIDLLGFKLPGLPIKANNANAYVLERMSVNQYPNLYFTIDFINYERLTDFEPQKEYRWYTNEMINWKLPDGTTGEGILYKPEDFNPTKKYPIIFYYYEKPSSAFNMFIHPELSTGVLSIPWFVSREYLVFVPDITFKIGFAGESAYSSVVSAAKVLSKYKWIDKNKMGLQGHSFGGFETNYIITRTNLFKAAASSAGPVSFFSAYGQPNLELESNHNFFEFGQGRMGADLWQKKDLYLANSPILNADKIKTPLLIMHNKEDVGVNWSNAFELFTGLASMKKEVYMLDYDGEGHTIFSEVNKADYSMRLTQFFDVHLKNKPLPLWMSKGISAYRKGFDNGFGLDFF